MANGNTQDQNWDRAHSDINVLAQRVSGIENSITGITSALGELSKKLDAKPTNWFNFFGTGAAILSVAGAFFWQDKIPTNALLEKHDREISKLSDDAVSKSDFNEYEKRAQARVLANESATAKVTDNLASAQKDIADANKLLSAIQARQIDYHDQEVKDIARIDLRVDGIDAQFIGRPDLIAMLNGLSERITTVANGLHEATHDASLGYNVGDRLKSLEAELAEARKQTSVNAAQGK